MAAHAQAALRDTRIPLVELAAAAEGAEDEEPELELDDDPAHAKPVDTRRVPLIITASQAPRWLQIWLSLSLMLH